MDSKGAKRKASDDLPATSSKKASRQQLVNPQRVRVLKPGDQAAGPVIYWCVVSGSAGIDCHHHATHASTEQACACHQ